MSRSAEPGGAIGVFGGMFDPVHFGHLRTAYELKLRLDLDEVRFVPCAAPPHREAPIASGALRVRMLRAALATEPGLVVDERELERPGPSYTVETLASMRAELPEHSLSLLLGMDAFLGLPRWHEWRSLPELAHIVVAQRPGAGAPQGGAIGELLAERATTDVAALRRTRAGKVLIAEVTQLKISSTELKDSIRAGLPPRYLVPESVWQIIVETRCYAEETHEVVATQ